MTDSLAESVTRYTDTHLDSEGHYATAIPAVSLLRSDRPTAPLPTHYRRSALCVVVQGAKRVMLGGEALDYGAMQYVLTSVDLPMVANVTRATAAKPFLAFSIDIDLDMLREIADQLPTSRLGAPSLGVYIGDFQPPAADCAVRLLRLMETPKAIPVLYPLIARELYYWLLTGSNGPAVRQLATRSARAARMAKAIRLLRENFTQPMRIEQLARTAGMSESSFHAHFKALTAMSPLQYQKQLRLLEARRLMVAGSTNASQAAYRVGYTSPSQFSREYARMFGNPPSQDVVF